MVQIDKNRIQPAKAKVPLSPSTHRQPSMDTEPPDEVRRKASFLSKLKSIHRQPPHLQLRRTKAAQNAHLDALLKPEIARVTGQDNFEFAFSLAELAWRLEESDLENLNVDVSEGLAVLGRAARMYEILFMLQNGIEE